MLFRSAFRYLPLLTAGLSLFLSSCETTPQAVIDRNNQIRQEPRGDYYIGRRLVYRGTRFWGIVRRPGELWETGKLVMINERYKRQPDRLTENPSSGENGFQYDANSEYRLKGSFSGRKIYDPNSDKILPEFVLRDYELITPSGGWLYHPREKKDPYGIPIPR